MNELTESKVSKALKVGGALSAMGVVGAAGGTAYANHNAKMVAAMQPKERPASMSPAGGTTPDTAYANRSIVQKAEDHMTTMGRKLDDSSVGKTIRKVADSNDGAMKKVRQGIDGLGEKTEELKKSASAGIKALVHRVNNAGEHGVPDHILKLSH